MKALCFPLGCLRAHDFFWLPMETYLQAHQNWVFIAMQFPQSRCFSARLGVLCARVFQALAAPARDLSSRARSRPAWRPHWGHPSAYPENSLMHWAKTSVCLMNLERLRGFSDHWWTPQLLLKLFGSSEAILLTSGYAVPRDIFWYPQIGKAVPCRTGALLPTHWLCWAEW